MKPDIKTLINFTMLKKILPAFIIMSLPAFSLLDDRNSGRIDWSTGTVISYGVSEIDFKAGIPSDPDLGDGISLTEARIQAYKKAREKASENLVVLMKKIRVDSERMLYDLIEKNRIFRQRISEVIGTKAVMRDYPAGFHRSGCSAELRLRDIILAIPVHFPMHEFPSRLDNPIQTAYTGLVIDARGMAVTPMLFPVIYNRDGLEVYGRDFIEAKSAEKGIVAYAFTEREARGDIAGDRPYYAAAIKELNGCPVLSDRDIKKIFSHRETLNNLKKCRVIFIIDKKSAGEQ